MERMLSVTEEKINLLREIIHSSKRIVFFGGAGISTASGIPDFRSAEGLYAEKEDGVEPEMILSKSFFFLQPEAFFRFYRKHVHFSDHILMREPTLRYKTINESLATIISCEESRSFLDGIGIKGEIINTSTNARTAFSMIAQWAAQELPDCSVLPDNRLLSLSVTSGGKETKIAVKTGCTGLGSRNANGEWNLLPGIDYIFYCFDIEASLPIIEQFHVFTKDEFLQMWRDLKLIVPKISTAAHKRLRAIYGEDMIFSTEDHADIMSVQVFKTSRKKTKMFEDEFAKKPVLTTDILKDICN